MNKKIKQFEKWKKWKEWKKKTKKMKIKMKNWKKITCTEFDSKHLVTFFDASFTCHLCLHVLRNSFVNFLQFPVVWCSCNDLRDWHVPPLYLRTSDGCVSSLTRLDTDGYGTTSTTTARPLLDIVKTWAGMKGMLIMSIGIVVLVLIWI